MLAPWLVPLVRPPSFVGREAQLAKLSAHISAQGCRRMAIYGLGGCGKTALALETIYQIREQYPKRSIFWVPLISRDSFEQAYREIGILLRIPGVQDAKYSFKQLVQTKLSDERFGEWLMVVDNADDVRLLFGQLDEGKSNARLIDYLPKSRKGSIVFTTRTAKAAVDLAGNNVIELGELNGSEARNLLKIRLFEKHCHLLDNDEIVHYFLRMLSFLALAVVQAIAFINKNDISLLDYIKLYRANKKEAANLLSSEFEDQGRYRESKNPVLMTWAISFEQIQNQDELAAHYLSFMACVANNEIPETMLPPQGSLVQQTEAIGTLKAYAFITEYRQQCQERNAIKVFNIHPLVHLATRSWLEAHCQWKAMAEMALVRLLQILPLGDLSTVEIWTAYLPHAKHVIDLDVVFNAENRMLLLIRIIWCQFKLGQYRSAKHNCHLVAEWNRTAFAPRKRFLHCTSCKYISFIKCGRKR